jgi:hypothetical protein
MASNDISKYHGRVSKCDCGLYDHPERQSDRSCKICFGRAFVAECTGCDGKGQVLETMAGGPGTMKATCNKCGGVGRFGVNKPADWVDAVPEAAPVEQTAVA